MFVQHISIGPTSLDWPAWIQAVGSIAAILVAVALSRLDAARRRTEADERQNHLTQWIESQISALDTQLTNLEHLLKSGADTVRSFQNWMIILNNQIGFVRLPVDRALTLSVASWPDPRLFFNFGSLSDWCGSLLMSVSYIDRNITLPAIAVGEEDPTLDPADCAEVLQELQGMTLPTLGRMRATLADCRKILAEVHAAKGRAAE